MIHKIQFTSLTQMADFLEEVKRNNYKVILRNENGFTTDVSRLSNIIYMTKFDTTLCHLDFDSRYSMEEQIKFKNILKTLNIIVK